MRILLTGLTLLAVLPPYALSAGRVVNGTDAGWMPTGTRLALALGVQNYSAIVSDGAGGAIVAWADARAGGFDIYVQRIGGDGTFRWLETGVAVCVAAGDQGSVAVAADGSGGAIIAWADDRTGTYDIYAQRINSTGTVQWAANGVAVCTATEYQLAPQILVDGAGISIIAWNDHRNGIGNQDIFAQRLNGAGVPQWISNGIIVCNDGTTQDSHRMVSDGAGGAIVVWRDFRYGAGDTDIMAQRVSSGGAALWTASGQGVCTLTANQEAPLIVSDGTGGAFVCWSDYRTGTNWDIFATRLNSSGSAQWTSQGSGVTQAGWDEISPVMASDGNGGAYFAWAALRYAPYYDIYAQRMNATGAPSWDEQGIGICGASFSQTGPSIVSEGNDGFILWWRDERNGAGEIFTQRVNKLGRAEWTAGGESVCEGYPYAILLGSVADGAGGTILTWTDQRGFSDDVYVQRMDNVHGFWGHPEPIVETVRDIGHDEGGEVAVNWTASGRDEANPRTIDFYSVWRAVDAIPSGAARLSSDDLKDLRADDAGPVYLSTPGQYFERIGTQSAHGWLGYSFAASTRADSVASAPGDEVFMVAAHYLNDSYVAFASNEVSGHSVDNLAPLAPFLLTAQRVGSDVHLNWNRAVAPDLRDYSLYRTTSSGVTPVPINFLESAEDTLAIDANAPASALYYIVTALDVHANQSPPSNEASVGATTDIGNTPALTAFTVLDNMPNPFTSTTTLRIGLPKASAVEIDMFDVAGRRVRSERTATLAAGWREISFAARDDRGRALASGVYFYRVKAAGATVTKKMVIAR